MPTATPISRGAVVISVPALREPRWYIVQIGDMFDEIVYNIGGSKGAEPGLFCLTGPDYHGPIPATMKEIKVRTKLAVVANRVFVNGEADIPRPAPFRPASTCCRCRSSSDKD